MTKQINILLKHSSLSPSVLGILQSSSYRIKRLMLITQICIYQIFISHSYSFLLPTSIEFAEITPLLNVMNA